MNLKRKIIFVLALGYFVVSCSSQPTGSDEDLASDKGASSEVAASDTNADPAVEKPSEGSDPVDEFSENTPENPPPPTAENPPPQEPAKDEFSLNEAPLNEAPQPEPAPSEQPMQDQPLAEQPPAEPQPQPQQQEVPPQETAAPVVVSEPAPVNKPVTIKGIQFKGNDTGGSLVLEASGPFTYTTRKKPELNQLIIEIPNSEVLAKVLRPLNMKEFKGGIASVDTYKNPGTQITRVVLQMRAGASDPFIQLEGNSLVVATNEATEKTDQVVNTDKLEEMKQSSTQELSSKNDSQSTSKLNSSSILTGQESISEFLEKNTKFYGEIIDCNFDDMETKEVINLLASSANINLITEEVPASKISISLNRVAWDQCLTVIMKIKKLGYAKIGNILRIATLDVLSKELNDKVKEYNDRKQIDPTKVQIFPISFAEGSDLQDKMKIFLTKDRGSISFDSRTNSMIVIDTEDVLKKIGIMIRNLDTPPAQVLIEGKIVEANENFQNQIGVNWGFSGQAVSLVKGKVEMTPNFSLGKASSTSEYGFGLNIGVLDVLGSLAATLALLEKEDKVKVLSSPRVVSINNNKATISAKNDVKNAVVDNTGKLIEGATMSTALTLEVTPQVTNDGSVKMNIKVLRSYPGIASNPSLPASAPKYERNVETNVLVKNGQTSVIGGIFQNDTAEGEVGISGLKDIPILGYLFRQKSSSRINTELLVFLTPKILTYNDIEAVKQ